MRLRSDQSGFTLIEMLVSCTLGLIVLTAALQLMVLAQHSATKSTERADDAQRGRLAMEQIVQGLRSATCGTPDANNRLTPLVYADGSKVVLYRNIAGRSGNNATAFRPDKHTYQLTAGRITDVTNAGVGTYPNVTFPTASAPRLVVDNASTAGATTPLFTYYAYQPDGTIDPTKPLPNLPLSVDDLERVVQVRIRFVTRPTDGSTDAAVQASFDDTVTTAVPITRPDTNPTSWRVECPL